MFGAAMNGRETRSSALWGSGGRGNGGTQLRGIAACLALAAALLAPAAATADPGKGKPQQSAAATYLPGTLLAEAQANPGKRFDVIVELKRGGDVAELAAKVRRLGKLTHRFVSIGGVSAQLPGAAIVSLAKRTDLLAITRDAPTRGSGFHPAQVWPLAIGADKLWPQGSSYSPKPPTIAVVDSGVEPARTSDFGGRLVASVNLSSLTPGATGDGEGHGTFVASIAAGASSTHPGVAPGANIVSLRVMDDHGTARTSDVIAAADWLLENKDAYGIRVANFSLHSTSPSSFKFDPLDHAVERLWFAGVVVVAASGNFGDGTPQPMFFAPGNDPFVITVGATDTHDTVSTADDDVPYWSAYGHTADGFAKPEVVAPGRYLIGAVPETATLYSERPDHVVEPGYMRLSGTSFAAPAVAGAAAKLLALHPGWTPDLVKGALMATAHPLAVADPVQDGVGEIDMVAANALAFPPNPNAGLDAFVVSDATVAGGLSFDAVSWNSAASQDVSWNSVSWADTVSWADVSWASVSWADVSWASVSWADASQADAALADTVSSADVSWADVSWADGATAE